MPCLAGEFSAGVKKAKAQTARGEEGPRILT